MATRPPCFPALRSSSITSSMKFAPMTPRDLATSEPIWQSGPAPSNIARVVSIDRAHWISSTLVLGFVIASGADTGNAKDLVSCRMPNGEVRIVAVPPEGCVVTEPFKLRRAPRSSPATNEVEAPAIAAPAPLPWPPRGAPGPAPTPEQPELAGPELASFLEWATKNRQTIEERAEEIAQRLERHHEEVAALPEIKPENFQSSPHGNTQYLEAVRKRAENLEEMRAAELEILRELEAAKDEFSVLSSQVTAANGGELPETWKPQLECDSCPRS